MKIVQINSFGNLSTGSVMRENHRRYVEQGHESWMMWGRGPEVDGPSCEYNFGTKAGSYLDVLQTRLFGKAGFYSKGSTKRLLAKLDEIQPDCVHLHNLHGYYLNVEMLFDWLAAHDCKVEWTLHDCWAFTGHCAYFTYVKCAQWQGHCAYSERCPQIKTYPKTISQASVKWNFERKRELFTMLPSERMTIVTPSQWLANHVGQSFLAKYPVEVRYNTIDTEVFKPTPSDFRQRYGLEGKFIILGVASTWTERKGLRDFMRLAQELDDSYAIVLVGLSPKQIGTMSHSFVCLGRTETKQELAGLYTTADVHVQPSAEETFGMTVAEAQACGTDVIVRTGSACAEIADNAISVDNFGELRDAVLYLGGGGCVVIAAGCTESVKQLAMLYTATDLFFNPTREDNYPTVNLEAQACDAPVIAYDVGGCAETIISANSQLVATYSNAFSAINYMNIIMNQGLEND